MFHMSHIISALLIAFSSAVAFAQAPAAPLELAPDAPDRHIVVPGDTLWGISSKFLKDPFRWPEIWRLNTEQVKNPHRIYPGQVVILDLSDGQPRLKLGTVKAGPKIYEEKERKEIPAIPQQAIEPFLSEPLVVEATGLDAAPRIVATQEDRVVVGSGNLVYAENTGKETRQWQIYRPGKPLIDPDTNEVLGLEAIYLGRARTVRPGDEVSTLEITVARQEIGAGDRLVPASGLDVPTYAPHAPANPISGRIMSIYGGVGEAGRHSIVTLSRGKRDGVEVGHVLAINRAGAQVSNRFDEDKPAVVHQLPDEAYGLVFVFRVFDRVSYALVMGGNRPVVIGDIVKKP